MIASLFPSYTANTHSRSHSHSHSHSHTQMYTDTDTHTQTHTDTHTFTRSHFLSRGGNAPVPIMLCCPLPPMILSPFEATKAERYAGPGESHPR